MTATHVGNYELDNGNYGATYRLEDGTLVNAVTVFSSPGLAADTELEADRPLTDDEQNAVLNADAQTDHATEPRTQYRERPHAYSF